MLQAVEGTHASLEPVRCTELRRKAHRPGKREVAGVIEERK